MYFFLDITTICNYHLRQTAFLYKMTVKVGVTVQRSFFIFSN